MGLTYGVAVVYGLASVASTAMITSSIAVFSKGVEVASLQYKKSTIDQKEGWMVANDMLSSVYGNTGRILTPYGTKSLTTFAGYSMHMGYFKTVQMTGNQFLNAGYKLHSYLIAYGFAAYSIYQTYVSIKSSDPVKRAYERGYSLI